MILMRDLSSDQGRHDFIINSRSQGPNVFYNGSATNALNDTGPHQRWSTGALFDNITVQGDEINFRNRGNFGSGHGWAGANMVAWNCVADGYIVQSPPTTAQNWLIGSQGAIIDEDRFGPQPDAIIDSHGTPVATTSLYLKQLADRTARPNGQHFEYVLGDFDNYVNDGSPSVDDTTMSQSFLDEFGGYLATRPTMNFDQTSVDHWVPLIWNFDVDPDQQVFHAVLTIALKKPTGRTRNDSIWVDSFDNRLFFDVDLGFTEEFSTNESTMVVLEFTGPDLALLNDGELNILIGEDVALDWARLDLYIAERLIGDLDEDGFLTNCDLTQFITLLDAGDPRADLTNDTPPVIDFLDALAFQTLLETSGATISPTPCE